MGIEQTLAAMGFSPAGTAPKPTNPLVDIVNMVGKTYSDFIQKRAQQKKDAFEMFKIIKDAGYVSQSAYKAVLAKYPEIPAPSNALSLKEQETQSVIDKNNAYTKSLREGGGTRGFTREQQESRRIGKQNIIRTIRHWGDTGQAYDYSGKAYMPVETPEEFQSHMTEADTTSKYFDMEDPDIKAAYDAAVEKRTGEKQEVKTKAAVGKGTQTGLFNMFRKPPEQRFNELVGQLGKEGAYKQMLQEGY
jgi:hypothetical protein